MEPCLLVFHLSTPAPLPPQEGRTGGKLPLGGKKSKGHFTHIYVVSAILGSQLLKEPPGSAVSSGCPPPKSTSPPPPPARLPLTRHPSPTLIAEAERSAAWETTPEQCKKLEWGGTCKELVPCFLRLCCSSRHCLSGMSTSSTTPGAHCAILCITSSGTEKLNLFSTFLGGRHRDGGLASGGDEVKGWGMERGAAVAALQCTALGEWKGTQPEPSVYMSRGSLSPPQKKSRLILLPDRFCLHCPFPASHQPGLWRPQEVEGLGSPSWDPSVGAGDPTSVPRYSATCSGDPSCSASAGES